MTSTWGDGYVKVHRHATGHWPLKDLQPGGKPESLAVAFQHIQTTEMEVSVIADLPVAYAPFQRASVDAPPQRVSSLRVVPMLSRGHATAASNHEWRLTLALSLNQMPSGSNLVIRDASGRDWRIAPAGQAAVQSLREAA